MNKYSLHLNSTRCIACHGCEVHCKINKELPPGILLCALNTTPMFMCGGIPKSNFTFDTCRHCEEPLCVDVCPTGAMIKRGDGIVYIDSDTCIGCMACTRACPWDIPIKNPESRKAVKCDLCYDRIDAGLKPACVSTCTTHALNLVRLEAE